MQKLIEQIEEILEVENLDINKKFDEYDEWDSLCSLSIIALVDSEYHKTISNKDLISFNSIKEFCESIVK